jgi:2-polyprenyl-3-methyl-5-hydroxy-6-metoxy-1,4-benzoquinol methylase
MADQASEGLLSPFHREQRLKAARPFLKGSVLDLGCGSGALARHVDPDRYLGIDMDVSSVEAARKAFPSHRFQNLKHIDQGGFDTVVALAVIEHVPSPAAFLKELKGNLARKPEATIVCTTPHPSMDFVHWIGSRLGLFSSSANEEHEDLLDRRALEEAGREAGLVMTDYRRFLFGANQIAVYAAADLPG